MLLELGAQDGAPTCKAYIMPSPLNALDGVSTNAKVN